MDFVQLMQAHPLSLFRVLGEQLIVRYTSPPQPQQLQGGKVMTSSYGTPTGVGVSILVKSGDGRQPGPFVKDFTLLNMACTEY